MAIDRTFALMVTAGAVAAAAAGWWLPGPWYSSLEKPWWVVPAPMLAVIWPVVTIVIALAGRRLWQQAGASAAKTAYLVQLGLVSLWTLLFFGLGRLDLALVDTAALAVAVTATTALAWPVDRRAALLLLPYLGWVLYAAAMVAALWSAN
jgi:translocator protein